MSLSIGSPGTGSAPRPGSLPGPGRVSGPGRPAKKPSRRTTQVRRNALVMAWLLIAAVLAALTIVGPLSSWGTWLTQEAYDRLSAELEHRKTTMRKEIAQRVEAARQEGDLRENAGYHAAREEAGLNEARIMLITIA